MHVGPFMQATQGNAAGATLHGSSCAAEVSPKWPSKRSARRMCRGRLVGQNIPCFHTRVWSDTAFACGHGGKLLAITSLTVSGLQATVNRLLPRLPPLALYAQNQGRLNERYRPCRRNRFSAPSADPRYERASSADLQQADDLLSAADAGGCRNRRHLDRHRRKQRRRILAPAAARQGFWTATAQLCLPGRRRRNCGCLAPGGIFRWRGKDLRNFRSKPHSGARPFPQSKSPETRTRGQRAL